MFKNMLYLSIFAMFVVVTLIASNVYHNLVQSKVAEDTTIKTTSISPVFDLETLEDLKLRKKIFVDLKEKTELSKQTTTSSTSSGNLSLVEETNQEATSEAEINNLGTESAILQD